LFTPLLHKDAVESTTPAQQAPLKGCFHPFAAGPGSEFNATTGFKEPISTIFQEPPDKTLEWHFYRVVPTP